MLAPGSRTGVIEGRVVAVHDGDTISVRVDGAPMRIRLADIDTPESGQPWTDQARRALSARVFDKEVRVIEVAVDVYGRTVGEVYADDVCVGCELVREGHAWVYRRYTDDAVLLRLEADARARGAGLWSLPESQRLPPWEWRRRGFPGAGAARAPRPPPNLDCGSKRYCREMSSCEEAHFHLEQCGLTRLDGDADGVPCEKICGGR
jgi:endonuclease YncB( thermonuclease family)